jgi:uncharacterized protein (UPF0335 family)
MPYDLDRAKILINKLTIAKYTIEGLIAKINRVEDNNQTLANEKLFQIKKIREEILKVSDEIDNLKKEIRLLKTNNIN